MTTSKRYSPSNLVKKNRFSTFFWEDGKIEHLCDFYMLSASSPLCKSPRMFLTSQKSFICS